MPVILEFEEKLLRERMPSFGYVFKEDVMAERVKAGLRATLQTESLVTGVLYVGIDMDPKASDPVFHQLEKRYPRCHRATKTSSCSTTSPASISRVCRRT